MGASTVRPLNIKEVAVWHDEADVVVVGFGCAGASAAIGAREVGASAVIVERTGGWGGASAMSGGEIYMGGGTPVQTACGFEDSPENMLRFLTAATGPDADQAKLELYCHSSVDHFGWLVQCGVEFKHSFYAEPCWEPPTDDGLMFTGGENAYPFNEIAEPAPRGHIPRVPDKQPGERAAGLVLMTHLAKTVEDLGVSVRYNTISSRLIVTDDGRVVGVEATEFGERRSIRAHQGVVLAAGGFAYNEAMLGQHVPRFVGHEKVGPDTDDGGGIQMGLALGAAVRHMDAGQTAFPADPQLLYRSLLLNGRGQRFMNEDGYPGRVGQTALLTQGGATLMLYDDEINEQLFEAAGYRTTPTWVSDDLHELETLSGLPSGSLTATVDVFNRHAESGLDPLCHKAPQWLKPLSAPYGLLDLRSAPFRVFTTGGLSTSVDGEVRHVDGDLIAGLYAAGRTSSGVPAWGYLSGTSLGDGTFFGRRAGRAAGSQPSTAV